MTSPQRTPTVAALATELDVDTRAVGLDVTALCRAHGPSAIVQEAGSLRTTVLTAYGAGLVRDMEGAKR